MSELFVTFLFLHPDLPEGSDATKNKNKLHKKATYATIIEHSKKNIKIMPEKKKENVHKK